MLGGVCGGIAPNTSLSAGHVRLIAVALFFVGSAYIPIIARCHYEPLKRLARKDAPPPRPLHRLPQPRPRRGGRRACSWHRAHHPRRPFLMHNLPIRPFYYWAHHYVRHFFWLRC
jgi:hypothetical protein